MPTNGFQFENHLPVLNRPWLIAGFTGWGNAMNVAAGAIEHLVQQLGAQKIGSIDSDVFYRYDENRPVVRIEAGGHIQGLIEKNEELQKLVGKLRKEKMRGNWSAVKPPADLSGKLINLKDFLEPK
jgi:hypothetical protein